MDDCIRTKLLNNIQEYLEKLESQPAGKKEKKKKRRLEIQKGNNNPQMKGSGLVVIVN